MTATDTKLTFADLATLEPGLRRLEADIRRTAWALRRKRRRCRNGIWFGFGRYPYYGYKRRLTALVGHFRDARLADPAVEELLRSSRAYDVAYRHLYELVPECRICSCW